MHLYVYWLPEYLYRQRGFSLTQIGLFAWVPFLFADGGSIFGVVRGMLGDPDGREPGHRRGE